MSINHYFLIAARIDKMNKVFITKHFEVIKKNEFCEFLGRGGGLVVSVLTLYSKDPGSNTSDY